MKKLIARQEGLYIKYYDVEAELWKYPCFYDYGIETTPEFDEIKKQLDEINKLIDKTEEEIHDYMDEFEKNMKYSNEEDE